LLSRFSAVFTKIFDLMLDRQDVVKPRQLVNSTPQIGGQEQSSSRASDALAEQSDRPQDTPDSPRFELDGFITTLENSI
jgi:hypothetical protein